MTNIDDPDEIKSRLRNLVNNFNRLGFWAMLEEMSFDQVVEAWWAAQARKAARSEARTARSPR